jgi:hypothetical protein
MTKQLPLPFLRRQRAIINRRKREKGEAAASLTATRQCPKCQKWFEDRVFAKYLQGGRVYGHTKCNQCRQRRYKRSGACRAKRAFLMELRHQPCVKCGYSGPPEAKRFVCQQGLPRFNLAASWSGRDLNEIKEEAKRHLVMCANCASLHRADMRYRKSPQASKLAELPPDLKELAGLSVDQPDRPIETQSQ